MEVARYGSYEEFRAFTDRASAQAMCSWFEFEGVPSRVEPRALAGGIDWEFVVIVSSRLAHRARRIAAQAPPTDAELEFLATGRFPGNAKG